MMKKKWMAGISITLALALLSGCGTVSQVVDTAQQETPKVTTQAENVIALDYAEGIAQGVYGWTLSEDGSYYMLSAINEDGSVNESEATQSFMGGGVAEKAGGALTKQMEGRAFPLSLHISLYGNAIFDGAISGSSNNLCVGAGGRRQFWLVVGWRTVPPLI